MVHPCNYLMPFSRSAATACRTLVNHASCSMQSDSWAHSGTLSLLPACYIVCIVVQVVLRKLAGADPEGRRHCIKLLRTFEYRSHLCLVFEAMVSWLQT